MADDLTTPIQVILDRADIVDVAQALGIDVREAKGRHPVALCPFHSDTKPSLTLFRDRGNPHYHCFACGQHGGVIDLVANRRQASPFEAAKWLAERYGIAFPSLTQRANPGVVGERIVAWGRTHGDKAKLESFAGHRGFSAADLRKFDVFVGSLDRIISSFRSEPDLLNALVVEGYAKLQDDGSVLPLFKGDRVAFPIDGGKGGIIFRALEEVDSALRYRFPRGFKKQAALYGYEAACKALEAGPGEDGACHLFIVEGVTDAIRMWSLGFATVATLGAGLSSEQSERIRTLSERCVSRSAILCVHIFFDFDKAGASALPRSLKNIFTQAVHDPVFFVDVIRSHDIEFEIGKDPDELFRRGDADYSWKKIEEWCVSAMAALASYKASFSLDTAFSDFNAADALTRARVLRFVDELLGPLWPDVLNRCQPDRTFLIRASDRVNATPLSEALRNFAARPSTKKAARAQTEEFLSLDQRSSMLDAIEISRSSNYRREFPTDWGSFDRISKAADLFFSLFKARLADPEDRCAPYVARYVPREDGRPRLKAGPWPEDSILQQYVLGEILRLRDPQVSGDSWHEDIPAVRRLGNRKQPEIIVTGPRKLTPSRVVSYAYQISQDILEKSRTTRREGMFVPYRECWQGFIDALFDFVATEKNESVTFYVARLDISGFYDNLPKYAVDDVVRPALRAAMSRHFEGGADVIAPLLLPHHKEAEERANAMVDWILRQSFSWKYFSPESGEVKPCLSSTMGIPQGPDLSAYLANISLFPLDRAVVNYIDHLEKLLASDRPKATYARYVDDMVIIATTQEHRDDIEAIIRAELGKIGLQLNFKHVQPPPMNRFEIREWLVGDKGAGIQVSIGGDDSPETDLSNFLEFGGLHFETRREALSALFDPSLDSAERNPLEIAAILKDILRVSDIRYYDKVNVARRIWWLAIGHPNVPEAVRNSSAREVAAHVWKLWKELIPPAAELHQNFGESASDYQRRQNVLTAEPFLIVLDSLERTLESRWDRKLDIPPEVRESIAGMRSTLITLVKAGLARELATIVNEDVGLKRSIAPVRDMIFNQVAQIEALASIADPSTRERLDLPTWLSRTTSSGPAYPFRRIALTADAHALSSIQFSYFSDALALEELPLALHEEIARLASADDTSIDPLFPVHEKVRSLASLFEGGDNSLAQLTTVLSQLLPSAPEAPNLDEDLKLEIRRGIVGVVVGRPAAISILRRRPHLFRDSDGEKILAIPSGLGIQAFFKKGEKLQAIALSPGGAVEVDPSEILLGVSVATKNTTERFLAVFDCKISYGSEYFKVSADPSKIAAEDLPKFACAYRNLAEYVGQEEIFSSIDHFIPTSETLIQDQTGIISGYFSARTQAPANGRAFIHSGDDGLQSITVPTQGQGLWRNGYALADAFGYRQFLRSGDLDRLITPAQKSIIEDPNAIAREVLGRSLPLLCGSRPLKHSPKMLPKVIDRALRRLESFPLGNESNIQLRRLLHLIEITVDVRARRVVEREIVRSDTAGALSWTLVQMARATYTADPVLVEFLPKEIPIPQQYNRRVADIWSGIGRRLKALASALGETPSVEFSALLVGTEALSVSRAIRAQCLELWALLPANERLKFNNLAIEFRPAEPIERALLVSSHGRGKVLDATEQVERLLRLLVAATRDIGVEEFDTYVRGSSQLNQITPLGWLTIHAVLTGTVDTYLRQADSSSAAIDGGLPNLTEVFGSTSREGISDHLERLLTPVWRWFAHAAPDVDSDAADDSHPWAEFDSLIATWGAAQEAAIKLIETVDRLANIRTETVSDALLSISKHTSGNTAVRFSDGQRIMPIWSVDRDGIGSVRPNDLEHRVESNGEILLVASRTTRGRTLIGVGTVYSNLAELAQLDERLRVHTTDRPKVDDRAAPARNLSSMSWPSAPSVTAEPTKPGFSIGDRSIDVNANILIGDTKPVSLGRSEKGGFSDLGVLGELLWDRRWRSNSEENKQNRTRIAFLQIHQKVFGESYYHPIIEAGGAYTHDQCEAIYRSLLQNKPHANSEIERALAAWKAKGHSSISSKQERFRRIALQAVLQRCNKMGVNVLVLPEYSVRPETVSWLYSELRALAPETAIIAGTYRIFPDSKLPEEFKDPRYSFDSMSAVLTAMYPNGAKPPELSLRTKKYPAASHPEFIRPSTKALQPLFPSTERHGRHCIELICSEVFVAMSPTNVISVQPEILELRRKLGVAASKKLDDEIMNDLLAFGKQTSPSGNSDPRRTILLVPSQTSRPYDHHLFGQTNARADSLVTVFVNRSDAKGGRSCVIGYSRDGTSEGASVRHHGTCYHDVAPGVWGKDQPDNGALGAEENALVVVDVHPTDTAFSVPQKHFAIPPICLVAHLPLLIYDAHNLGVSDLDGKSICDFEEFLKDHKWMNIKARSTADLDASEAEVLREGLVLLEALSETSSGNWLERRRQAFERSFKIQPEQCPFLPALLDWIYIETDGGDEVIDAPPLTYRDLQAAYKNFAERVS